MLVQKCGDKPAQAFPCSLPLTVSEEKMEEVLAVIKELSNNCLTVKLYSKEAERYESACYVTWRILRVLPSLSVAKGLESLSRTLARFTVDFAPKDHTALFVVPGLATSTLPSLAEVAAVYQFQDCAADQTYFISHLTDLAEFYVQKSDLDIG